MTVLRHLGLDIQNTSHLANLEQLDLSGVSFAGDISLKEPQEPQVLFDIQHLNFAYSSERPILKNLSFTLNKGNVLLLLAKWCR